MALGSLASGGRRSGRDLSSIGRGLDLVLVGSVVALAVIGVVMVYSATRGAEPPFSTSFLVRQGLFVIVALVAMVVVALYDYRRLRDWAWIPFWAVVGMLVLVLSPLGSTIKGAQRWFSVGPFTLQPSEFAKVALVIALAALLVDARGAVDLGRLGRALAATGLVAGLVLLQPDLGTTLQYVAVVLVMLVVAGARGAHLLVLAVVAIALAVGVLTSDTLASYQRDRLTSFIDPSSDLAGTTYNQNQSVTAVASGGLTGQGLFDGPQTQLQFVPEQETDFIFAVVAEELGFVGGTAVLVLYGVVCWRTWRAARFTRDPFGALLCSGVLAILVFQAFANVGMALGIMPVTGTALPLLSYGGSSALATGIGLGLVLSVGLRQYR